MALAFEVLDVAGEYRRACLQRWEGTRRPSLNQFLPYATHVFKVDLLFYLGIHRGFISSDRPSNRVDMAYLYYLPFAMVFTSGDRLHRMVAPLFLSGEQSFLEASELKKALGEFDAHFDRLPDEIKDLGVLAFVSYPPSHMDNVVTRLWDTHMRRDWREIAKAQEAAIGKRRDEVSGQGTLAKLKQRLADAETISEEEARRIGDSADYFVISRRIPATKGKWRMVSRDVEEADSET